LLQGDDDMTTFLGVSPSEVCEWDTKASASDPKGQAQRLAADRRCRPGEQAREISWGSRPRLYYVAASRIGETGGGDGLFP
jgi:hypothetical protein